MPFIFLLFVVMPIVEIWVLIEVGARIGVFNTIGLVILTAVVGTAMLRNQGLAVLSRVRSQMAASQLPATEMIEGLILVVGGALLLTPGFVTDAIGFLCLIPPTRGVLASSVLSRFTVNGFASHQNRDHRRQATDNNKDAIEGEYRREE